MYELKLAIRKLNECRKSMVKWVTVESEYPEESTFFIPIQKLAKIRPINSSLVTCPVIISKWYISMSSITKR
jgi:hypothetical protein